MKEIPSHGFGQVRRRGRYRDPFFVISLLIALGATTVFLSGPAKGLYHRLFRRPPILDDGCIERLDPATAARQRERLFLIWSYGTGVAGLSQQVLTTRAVPIELVVVVRDGELTLVRDQTRDRHGGRQYLVDRLLRLEIGVLKEGESPPLVDRRLDRGTVYLKCFLPGGGTVYF